MSTAPATDKAVWALEITLAVGGTKMYMEFSEPTFTDNLGTSAILVSDFTYAGTSITPIESVGPGMRKAFFNLAIPLTGDNVVSDTIAPVNGSAVYDPAGNAMGAVVQPLSMLGLG